MAVASIESADDLRRLADGPFARQSHSPLGPIRFLKVTPNALEQIAGAADWERLNAWLGKLPCPVIGMAPGQENMLLDIACDAIVSSDAELAAVVTNIERSPLAATILVQTLRATAALSIGDGLTVESLAYATLQTGPEFRAWLADYRPPDPPNVIHDGPPVQVDRAGDRLTIRLNRPANRNALSVEMRDALCEALELAVADPTIGAVSISGAGRCFSVGGDLTEFGSVPDPATGHAIRAVRMPARLLADCADRVEFRLHGACIGAGAELPAFARRVVAKARTFFQLPELAFGLIPGAGGCVGIQRRIGRQRTAYLALSGRRISAATALRWGLIDALAD
jgi:enoyl-CoA hydratase/carnithine racemase